MVSAASVGLWDDFESHPVILNGQLKLTGYRISNWSVIETSENACDVLLHTHMAKWCWEFSCVSSFTPVILLVLLAKSNPLDQSLCSFSQMSYLLKTALYIYWQDTWFS